MSVPIHNLYDYIHQVLENRFCISYFYPFGEKLLKHHIKLIENHYNTIPRKNLPFEVNLTDSLVTKIFPESIIDAGVLLTYNPYIVCCDQEPLMFDFYEDPMNNMDVIELKSRGKSPFEIQNTRNLRWVNTANYQKKWILLHSELNSVEVEKYEQTEQFVGAYWWSHALLSIDWYRFAQYDQYLKPASDINKRFLLYSRDYTGTRIYRKKFLDMVHEMALHIQVGSFYEESRADHSAEYNVIDFNNTGCSIIAETVFDDRIHLTEKTLRALAVGHPFLLLAGCGSLKYLKKYGFKTFAPYINEDYDKEPNSLKRMQMVVLEIQRLCKLSKQDFEQIIFHCKTIANHNKKIFFNKDFFNQVTQELKDNVAHAYSECSDNFNLELMWEHRKFRKKQNAKHFHQDPKRKYEILLLKHLKKGGTLENYVPPNSD